MKQEKTCNQCKYWEQQKPYRWGVCVAPLPFFIMNHANIVMPGEAEASECDTFEGKGE